MHYVLGARGSGKTSVIPLLRARLLDWVVLDWDAWMDPAGELAGRPISATRSTWPAYDRLVHASVAQLGSVPAVLFGVCTPEELAHFPAGAWLLLDCTDAERTRRLAPRADGQETADAIADAAQYRRLGLPAIDTTNRTTNEVADLLADLLADGFGRT